MEIIIQIGKIKSFNYNIDPNGEFDCTTELTSMGNTLFKGQVEPQEHLYQKLFYRMTNQEEHFKNHNC